MENKYKREKMFSFRSVCSLYFWSKQIPKWCLQQPTYRSAEDLDLRM